MAEIDQLDYPNGPEGGIDFKQIGKSHMSHEITSSSGRTLKVEYQPGYISISDGDHRLVAEFNDYNNSLKLEAFTRDQKTGEKHPDMYYSRFVGVAVKHFEDLGLEIESARYRWNKDTDTFERFHEVLGQTGSKVEAALSNLPLPLKNRGFTDISDEDILIGDYSMPNSTQPSFVTATFRKKVVNASENQPDPTT